MNSNQPLEPGQCAYWFNTISLTSRPVTILSLRKGRYVVQTDDGHRYTPTASMVSRRPVDMGGAP